MAYFHNHNTSLDYMDLHNLAFLNPHNFSTYNMESNAACLVLQNAENNYCNNNTLSTGYLQDALIEFSVQCKRRKLMSTQFTDDLSNWNNWVTNYSMHSQEESNHASLLANHDMHYYCSGEIMEKSMKQMGEELVYNYQEQNDFLLEEIVGATSTPKIKELSSNSRDSSNMAKSTSLFYSSDTNSIDSSFIYGRAKEGFGGLHLPVPSQGDKEMKNKNKENRTTMDTRKMVYPFGLIKPGGKDGEITLNDINRRILRPPTRPLKHPVGDFACRPAVSPHGPGLSGKAVVALTRIQTQGKGTITIIRTKG